MCTAPAPRYPTYTFTITSGNTYNFRFEAGSSQVTGYNYQYGPTCDNMTTEIASTGDSGVTIPDFPYARQSFCIRIQAVNDCAVSNWTVHQNGGGRWTGPTGNSGSPALPVSGSAAVTSLFTLLGFAVIGFSALLWKNPGFVTSYFNKKTKRK